MPLSWRRGGRSLSAASTATQVGPPRARGDPAMRRPAWAGDDSVGQPCHERLACTLIDGAVGFRSAKHHAQTVGFDCLVRQVDPVLAELRCVKLRRHLPGFARLKYRCRPLRIPLAQFLGGHLFPRLLGGGLYALPAIWPAARSYQIHKMLTWVSPLVAIRRDSQ